MSVFGKKRRGFKHIEPSKPWPRPQRDTPGEIAMENRDSTTREQEYIECECGCEAIGMEYDPSDKWCELNISFWERGHIRDGKTSFRRKLYLVRQIMKTGQPYADMVIVGPSNATRLKTFLESYILQSQQTIDKVASGDQGD